MIAATDKPRRFTPYQWLIIIVISFTQFTVVLDFMIMNPLGDMLMKSLLMDTEQFGWVVSAYAFSAGVSGILTAGFADRFDRKKLLLFFYVGFIVGTLFCGLADTFELLVLARIFTGLFGGVIGSVSLAIIADLFALEQRGRVMGYVQMGFGASQILGIPISLYFANMWGWSAPFFMIVLLGLVIWIFIYIRMQPVRQHLLHPTGEQGKALVHLWKVLRLRRYRVGFLATALLSLGGFMMMPFGSAYAINNLAVTQDELPLMFMVSGCVSLLVMPLMGKIADRYHKVLVYSLATLLMISFVLIYTNISPVPFAWILLINTFMMVGVLARSVPAMAMVSALPEMHDRGAFMSINSSLQQMSGGMAAVIGGMIVVQETQHSPLQHFNWVGYFVFAVCLFSIYIFRRVHKSISPEPSTVS